MIVLFIATITISQTFIMLNFMLKYDHELALSPDTCRTTGVTR